MLNLQVVLISIDESGEYVNLQLVKYHFTGDVHALPKVPHQNSKGSTPYKRQLTSTWELLREAVKTNNPKEACKKVEEQLQGTQNVIGVSALPRNKQQAASLKRQLFPSTSSTGFDPIMALVDLYKTSMSGFIRSLQILPSPMCILTTDAQLHELVLNCTRKFGIMHLDPTFNLGNFFVTPIVFPLVEYIHRKNKGCPTFMGPVLIHQEMHHGVYNYFLNQLVSIRPELKQIKVVGKDGEAALCNAVKDNFPNATHLRCLKHIKDSIEQKLRDLKFDKKGIQELLIDIFGRTADGVREVGLADAVDSNDFFEKLMSLKKKWNDLEKYHRSFLLNQDNKCLFYDWFCSHYSNIFAKSVVSSVRIKAGMGSPPATFYNNRSESMNKLLKMHFKHQRSPLPKFITQLHEFVNEQFSEKRKADSCVGDWRKGQNLSNPELSMSIEEVQPLIPIDETILESIWSKAAELVHTNGQITRIPGDPTGCGRMVASASSLTPHLVVCGKKNNNTFICDKHFPQYTSYGFCSHSIAVAEVNEV